MAERRCDSFQYSGAAMLCLALPWHRSIGGQRSVPDQSFDPRALDLPKSLSDLPPVSYAVSSYLLPEVRKIPSLPLF